MWLLFGICIIAVTSECTDTNNSKNEYYHADNWKSEYERIKSPDDKFKLPTNIFLLSYPYNSNRKQWNKISNLDNTDNENEWKSGDKIIENNKSKYIIKMQQHSPGLTLFKWLFTPNSNNEKEHRNRSFSPWGGKRDSSPYKADPRIRRPSRVPFNSWGGKRDNDYYDNYSNNRHNANIKQLSNVNLPGIKKPFNSWGGKRTSPVVIEYFHHLSDDILNNIWQLAHSPLKSKSISINRRINGFRGDKNNGDADEIEKKLRITFQPHGM